MTTFNAKQSQLANLVPNPLRSVKRVSASRSRVDRTKAIAAPERLQEEQQTTIRLLDLDNAEQARLEQTDAFKELVALNKKKQSVNRPQQAGCRSSPLQALKLAAKLSDKRLCRPRSLISVRARRLQTASLAVRNATERWITRDHN